MMKAYVGVSSFRDKPAYVILNHEVGGDLFVTAKTADGIKAFLFDDFIEIVDSEQFKEAYSDVEVSYAVQAAATNAVKDFLEDVPNPVRRLKHVADGS